MIIVQSNSLPLPLEIFTQPCAERSKSLVEQSEEITVKSLLESNDIQPLGNKSRFLVAPLKRKVKDSEILISKRNRDFLFSGGCLIWQTFLSSLFTVLMSALPEHQLVMQAHQRVFHVPLESGGWCGLKPLNQPIVYLLRAHVF